MLSIYTALYNKYRPKTFSDVVGQEHITVTLKNEVASGKLSHAFLFTGTRGTGKTTCARILAKAASCKNPKDGDPCNECESCRIINEGGAVDILEIDAASNTGVDNIRSLREGAVFTPNQLKYRVYIIDEVHMLSIGAFNALLKTLEEPPEHVIFILATTELQKITPTILSRCQRFDFKRIDEEKIAERLIQVCRNEGIDAEDNAIALIARLGDGSMRDALSILDRCALQDGGITLEKVENSVGLSGRKAVSYLAEKIAKQDIGGVLSEFDKLYSAGKGASVLCSELAAFLRDLMVIQVGGEDILHLSRGELDEVKLLSKEFGLNRLILMLDRLQHTQNEMGQVQNARICFEMGLISLCESKTEKSDNALLVRIEQLEKEIGQLKANGIGIAAAASEDLEGKRVKEQSIKEEKPKIKEEKPKIQEAPKKKVKSDGTPAAYAKWGQLLLSLAKTLDRASGSFLAGCAGYLVGDELLISTENVLSKRMLDKKEVLDVISAAVSKIEGRQITCRITDKSEITADKKDYGDPFEELLDAVDNIE